MPGKGNEPTGRSAWGPKVLHGSPMFPMVDVSSASSSGCSPSSGGSDTSWRVSCSCGSVEFEEYAASMQKGKVPHDCCGQPRTSLTL